MDEGIAHAFKNGDYKRASELLQKVIDPNNITILGFYLEKYKHIDCYMHNVSLLHLASYYGWLDICHQLITKYEYSPHVRCSVQSLTNHLQFLNQWYSRSLLDTKSRKEYKYGYFWYNPPPPPLFYATLSGHYEEVKYLINKCNCDPHQQSEEGETPLYLACLGGHYEIVTYLISKCHCDPNIGVSYNKQYRCTGRY